MYIWIALKVDDKYIKSIRKYVSEYCDFMKIEKTALTLPQHISLKISFQSDDVEKVVTWLKSFIGNTSSLNLMFKSFDYHDGLLWMTFDDDKLLNKLHADLDSYLNEKFSIPVHEYDKNYYFHSTLVYDFNSEVQNKIIDLRKLLEDEFTLSEFIITKYIIGVSRTGKPGSFEVIYEGELAKEN